MDSIVVGMCVICKKETKYRCSWCKKAFYCDVQCQSKDWKDHKLVCKSDERGHLLYRDLDSAIVRMPKRIGRDDVMDIFSQMESLCPEDWKSKRELVLETEKVLRADIAKKKYHGMSNSKCEPGSAREEIIKKATDPSLLMHISQ